MKTLITFALLVLLGLPTQANTSAVLTTELLTHQIWLSTDLSDVNVYYDFQEPAILDIIEEKNGKISWTTAFWELIRKDGQDYILICQNIGNDPDSYHIAIEATHLILSKQNEEIIATGLNKKEVDGKINRSDIIGKWKSPFYHKRSGRIATSKTNPEKMWKTGFEFKKDGTFQRHIQIGSYVEAETGVWSLSSDSQFIKLHFTLNGIAEDIYKKEVLSIENFQGKNMKLSTDSNNDNILDEFELLKI